MHVSAAHLLASALLVLPASAGGSETPPLGPQTSAQEPSPKVDDWSGLDAEIQRLTLIDPDDGLGPHTAAMIRMDVNVTDYPDGWRGEDVFADLEWRTFGRVGDYDYRLTADFADPNGPLEDAYLRKALFQDTSSLTVGNFKTPILRSASLAPNKLLFNDRSVIGRCWNFYDAGAMFQSGFGAAQFMLAVQNGIDETEINYFYTGRFEYRFGGGVRNQAGAWGGQEHWNWSNLRSTAGFFILREESRIDGDGFGFDFAMTAGYWYFHAEALNLGQDLTQFKTEDNGMRPFELAGNSTPWSMALSYQLHPTLVGIQARYQRLDDLLSTQLWTLGMSWNQLGWNARFLFDVSQVKQSQNRQYFVQIGTAIYLD